MRTSKFLLLAAAALLSISLSVSADTYDAVQVKAWDVSATVHDVNMPSLSAADFEAPAATIATYTIPEGDGITANTRVFRDFRTIADSGGRQT